jgi:hypothetical protein
VADGYAEKLAEDATLWSVGEVSSADVVRVACDALVDGLDSQALRELAGASGSASDYEIEDLLQRAAAEIGFPFYERGGPDARMQRPESSRRSALRDGSRQGSSPAGCTRAFATATRTHAARHSWP